MAAIKKAMPECAITTDLISGFCGETLEDHEATLSLMREVGYASAFMFKYSVRFVSSDKHCRVFAST